MADDELVRFHCPKCNKRLKAPRAIAGKSVACAKCGSIVSVPPSSADVLESEVVEWIGSPEPKSQEWWQSSRSVGQAKLLILQSADVDNDSRPQRRNRRIGIAIAAGFFVVVAGAAVVVALNAISSRQSSVPVGAHSSATPSPALPTNALPYVLVDVRQRHTPDAEHRVATVYYPPPHNREVATQIVLAVYASLAQEVEASQPSATHKLVSITLYGDMWDVQHDPVCYLCDAGQQIAVPKLPSVPEIRWRWRDPQNAPDQRSQQWYKELIELANQQDRDGPRGGTQKQVILSMSAKYGVSPKEIHEAVWRVVFWKMNTPNYKIPEW
jgi:hypothetical protein